MTEELKFGDTEAKKEEDKAPLIPSDPSDFLDKPLSSWVERKTDAEFKDDTAKVRTRTITTTIRDTWWRFLFLAACCLVLIGSYYCYDNPAPVEKQLKSPISYGTDRGVEHGMNMSDLQYQLLYSLYSFPNIIIPLFGGYFIDRLGKRSGIVTFAAIVMVGQFFFAISTHAVRGNEGFGKFLAFFGRLVFGLGGENLSVTESSFVASWFKGKELSLALGIDLCVSKLFSAINDVTQPAFYEASGYRLSLGYWFGFLLCLASLGCALVLIIIDNKADMSCVQIELPVSQAAEMEEKEEEDESEEEIKWTDFQKLPKIFWLLTGSCVLTYMSFMSFMNISSDLLQTRFGYSSESAGLVMGLPYTLAAIITPVLGYMIDLHGLKTIWSKLLYLIHHYRNSDWILFAIRYGSFVPRTLATRRRRL